MCITASTGNLPTDTAYWQLVASKGDTGATGLTGATGAPGVIQTVNGKTGTSITLDKTDVGLGNVDNTSDANKPVSTAQQTALNAKANASDTVNLASRDYIASRGPSLVTNGQALLGNNYNFSLYTLDKTDKPTGAAGSFVAPVGAVATNLDEFMAINPARIYEMSFAVRQAAGDGARVFYSYLAPYDIDKLIISPYHYMEQAGTRTTLAAPLNPGDTTVTLTSSANWNNAAGSSSHFRTVIVWNYVDGQGYAWPAGTYSRNSRLNAYNDGAISGNVITLSTPWGLPAAPAGTAISNGSSGGSYMYGAQSVLGPSTWTNYAYKYSGIHTNNTVSATTSFPIATAYVKAGFLRNYPTSPVDPTSIQKFANVALVDITESDNKLPLAGGTMTGTLVAPSYDVSGAKILSATGFPEGVTSAPVGSIYIDKAVTNGIAKWVKKSGTANTGWQPDDITSTVPATATSTGVAGQRAYDSSYLYICTSTNTWKRTPLSSW